ncbi:MAG: ABC transporter ATP-binding protein [Euryarchaeota archaeon]|nr:ABC transporter ATP-binding protein [Euryarchaeota archaeon]
MSSSPPALEAWGLSRAYGGRPVLQGVDFAIARGESLAVVGANGSGKTTLVKLCGGLLRPGGGSVRVMGEDPRVSARARRRVGLLTHAPFLYPELTARENLEFYGHLYGVRELHMRIPELLNSVGLGPRGGERVSGYSRGMRQRLGLARALLHDPGVLLLDEPIAGLDVQGKELLRGLLSRFPGAILLTTGDPGEASLCRRQARLEEGGVIE